MLRIRKLLPALGLVFIISCGNQPSTSDAQKALESALGKLGKIEDVEKINGWYEDNNNIYVMEVKYKIKLNKEAKAELEETQRNAFGALIFSPLLKICTKNGNIRGEIGDECKGKAKLAFRKTDNGWMIINDKNKTQYIVLK